MNAKDACDLLNEMLEKDRYATSRLVGDKIICLPVLVDHPTIQVSEESGNYLVGFLGVLNGMLLKANDDLVVAVYEIKDYAKRLVCFETKTRAEVGLDPYEPKRT